MSDQARPGGAFYGRRKGKRLRAGQEERLVALLPQLRLAVPGGGATLDPRRCFGFDPEQVILEIGFGGGEHLAAEARAHPRRGFIGCEPFVNGMAKLLGVAADEGLANIRLWDRDATELLTHLAPASLDTVYLLYPDPWPKRRQRKRRFISPDTVAALARLIRPGGEFRFATDIDDYAGWTLSRLADNPAFRWTARRADDWRRAWPGWESTRYEQKALTEGRCPTYLTFERV